MTWLRRRRLPTCHDCGQLAVWAAQDLDQRLMLFCAEHAERYAHNMGRPSPWDIGGPADYLRGV